MASKYDGGVNAGFEEAARRIEPTIPLVGCASVCLGVPLREETGLKTVAVGAPTPSVRTPLFREQRPPKSLVYRGFQVLALDPGRRGADRDGRTHPGFLLFILRALAFQSNALRRPCLYFQGFSLAEIEQCGLGVISSRQNRPMAPGLQRRKAAACGSSTDLPGALAPPQSASCRSGL